MPNLERVTGVRQQIDFQFDKWVPDHPDFNNPAAPVIWNAIPGDIGRYRPVPGPAKFGNNSLRDLVPNATANLGDLISFRSPGAGPFYFTAAANIPNDTLHLFRFDEGTRSWIDVTPEPAPELRASSYARFSTFGTQIYASVGTSSSILEKDITTADRFADIGGAPRADDHALIRGFMVTISFIRDVAPFNFVENGVSWSASGNPENWINPQTDPNGAASVLRGEIQLLGGGRLQRIVPGVNGADAIIFGERKIWRMKFIGPPGVWDFQIVEEDEGTPLPTSVITSGNLIYFWGRRGWMVFDGATARPVGAGSVNRSFSRGDVQNGRYAFNASTQLALRQGIRATVSGEPFDDRLVLWTYRSDSESDTDSLVTSDTNLAIVTSDTNELLLATSKSPSNDTIIALNEVTGAWGNVKVPLQVIGRIDTNLTRTDAPELMGLDNDLSLVRFEGPNIAARFQTPELIGPEHDRITVRLAWAYVPDDNCTVSVVSREKLSDTRTVSPAVLREDDYAAPTDETGRFVAVRVDVPTGASWDSFLGLDVEWHSHGIGASQ